METPSSLRRVTRSQAAAAGSASGVCEKKSAMSTKGGGNSDRSALLNITNDSPIVGLTAAAAGGGCQKTPASSAAKKFGFRAKRTPGSGEALLRDQVKTLLQKVEEDEDEGDIVNKRRPLLPFPAIFAGLARSPAQLLAPTPANTPQISNSSFCSEVQGELQNVATGVEPKIMVVAAVVGRDGAIAPQECLINRALLFDEVLDEQAEEEEEEEVDDLCEGLRKMSVVVDDGELRLPEFTGTHTKFVYNDDDEMMIQREEDDDSTGVPAGALLLRGLPAPEGKHLRFQDDEDEV